MKLYYTIPEIATLLGVNPSHVRHYIKEFGIYTRGEKGRTKRIHKDDFEKLKRIHHEVTVEGRKYWKIKELIKKSWRLVKISD